MAKAYLCNTDNRNILKKSKRTPKKKKVSSGAKVGAQTRKMRASTHGREQYLEPRNGRQVWLLTIWDLVHKEKPSKDTLEDTSSEEPTEIPEEIVDVMKVERVGLSKEVDLLFVYWGGDAIRSRFVFQKAQGRERATEGIMTEEKTIPRQW